MKIRFTKILLSHLLKTQNRKIPAFIITLLLPFLSMNEPPKALYHSQAFSVYPSKVVQGKYTAKAQNAQQITSNYQSPANSRYGRLIAFKFSINGKDNELPYGVNHHLVLLPNAEGKATSGLLEFGKPDAGMPAVPHNNPFLEPNTQLTLHLDMRHVWQQFNTQGFYTAFNGEKIAKADFKGVYIAGGSDPLGWDFENLPARPQFELKDPDADGIYHLTLTLNAHNPDNFTANQWQLSRNLSGLPAFSSGMPLLDALYNLSLEEMLLNIRTDGAFMAGEKWDGVWTRDISYSILLSLAFLQPDVAKKSLLHKVANNRIIQDTGTGGSWPVSSDRMTWALAAWEVFLATNDKQWLQTAYAIIKNSADDDRKTLLDLQTGLLMGESSFLDWRKQSYPRWMNPVDIYRSQNLGTNAVHYQTYRIIAQMEKALSLPDSGYGTLARHLADSINKNLWLNDRQYYGQYLYGADYPVLSPRSETLGEALCVLFDIANTARARQVVSHTPVLPFGAPCFYPQISGIPPYHNNGIWPFVQAYFTWAAAKTGNTAAVEHGLAAIYRQAALFVTNKENMTADAGDFKGTEINSDRQLWSVAGNLATVYRIFYGMHFAPDGLTFAPFVPKPYKGTKTLTNFTYQNATLNVTLKGYGNKIKQCTINGAPSGKAFVPANASGVINIVIELANTEPEPQLFNLTQNLFSPDVPEVQLSAQTRLSWQPIPDAVQYTVYQNGKQLHTTTQTQFDFPPPAFYAQFQVQALAPNGVGSFLSKPFQVFNPAFVERIEAENFAPPATQPCFGFSGSGVAELSTTQNTQITLPLTVYKDGQYRLSFIYSNGSGPVNTDNKCAIRTLFIPNHLPEGRAIVFPQLGFEEWSNWGESNPLTLWLNAGTHPITLSLEPHNQNMNGNINTSLIDYLQVVQLR